jgi:hypothetical protein
MPRLVQRLDTSPAHDLSGDPKGSVICVPSTHPVECFDNVDLNHLSIPVFLRSLSVKEVDSSQKQAIVQVLNRIPCGSNRIHSGWRNALDALTSGWTTPYLDIRLASYECVGINTLAWKTVLEATRAP